MFNGTIESVYEVRNISNVYIGSEEIGYWGTTERMLPSLCNLLKQNYSILTFELEKR